VPALRVQASVDEIVPGVVHCLKLVGSQIMLCRMCPPLEWRLGDVMATVTQGLVTTTGRTRIKRAVTKSRFLRRSLVCKISPSLKLEAMDLGTH
jgi:hypothetical protein